MKKTSIKYICTAILAIKYFAVILLLKDFDGIFLLLDLLQGFLAIFGKKNFAKTFSFLRIFKSSLRKLQIKLANMAGAGKIFI